MTLWPLLTAAFIALIGVILARQYRVARGVHRPLSTRQPERRTRETPLGMEAIDMQSLDLANRRNESLERGQTNWLRGRGFFAAADTDVAPLADDETYAARFHTAFQKARQKD